MSDDSVRLLGIRHHGPGSARSVLSALEAGRPDCILVEGPPEADSIIEFVRHQDMRPPVALLVYSQDNPRQAVYYPFAAFSPEWQALRYAALNGLPVRFMDLPLTNWLALEESKKENEAEKPEEEAQSKDTGLPPISRDPLLWLARAAGLSDGERWWEQLVEQRRDSHDLFEAIREAMTSLRSELSDEETYPGDEVEPLREAHMRQSIRAAKKEGFKNIAVICGAWHTPALSELPPATADARLLKGLPKKKVTATWIPWTHSRLSYYSGYGAGVHSPGWYQHLWDHSERVAETWMTRVAMLLRERDLDASSAHIIETVRLAETLAAMRGRSAAGLMELSEATRAVLCFGDDLPMRLIHDRLIVGEDLGEVPAETQGTPLGRDLEAQQKSLRLKPETGEKTLDLDLRKEIDRGRSLLLHRLDLLGVSWGIIKQAAGKSGTFHEFWSLRWSPEFAVSLIEASVWGRTVAQAATACACDSAGKTAELAGLTSLLDRVLLADLPEAVDMVMGKVQAVAALASDAAHLMEALPPLARIARYGDVRKTNVEVVAEVIDGLVARICAGLPAYCSSLNDEAAESVLNNIIQVNSSIGLLGIEEQSRLWQECLVKLLEDESLHGIIAGRAARLLFDSRAVEQQEVMRRFGLALSIACEPGRAAAFADGFLRGSGLVLIHDPALLAVIDGWVSALSADQFIQVLPLLRRTFSSFAPPERRQIGERVKRDDSAGSRLPVERSAALDEERADLVLPVMARLLGLEEAP
ncbi:MAG: DUF5682 family protein [Candidatus Obscuribacterales bacterium]